MSFENLTDEQILAIANPIMDNLMDASTRIDYPGHIRDFSDRLKKLFNEERLRAICQAYQQEKGFFTERQFLALFRRPGAVALLWKQRFSKAEGDFVAEMLLIERDGVYLVDHVMVW